MNLFTRFFRKRNTIDSINFFVKIGIITVGVTLTMLHFFPDVYAPKIWSYLATIFLVFIPDIFRLMQIKIDQKLELAYYLFIIPAMILGIDFDLYKKIPPMDKIVHTMSGVLSAFVARSFLKQSVTSEKAWFKMIFIMGFVALTAAGWECFEFTYDQLFHGHMQQLISVGVEDTMWDIIVALMGGAVTSMLLFFNKDFKQ